MAQGEVSEALPYRSLSLPQLPLFLWTDLLRSGSRGQGGWAANTGPPTPQTTGGPCGGKGLVQGCTVRRW